MSVLTWIKNQPIKFERPNTQNCSNCELFEHYQLVDTSDVSQVQFNVQLCGGSTNVLTNDFNQYSLGNGWANDFGVLRKIPTNVFGLALLSGVIVPNTYYLFEVEVSENNGTIRLSVNGIFHDIIGVGLFRFVVLSGSSQNLWFQVYMLNNLDSCRIEYINAFVLGENFIFSFWDKDDNYQAEINTYTNPDAFVFAGTTLTLSIDWNDLNISEGCYKIKYHDSCVNTCGQNGIFNGGFANNDYWQLFTSNNRLRIIDGKLRLNNVGADYAQNAIRLCSGLEYKITWDFEMINNSSAFIRIGTNVGTTRTTSGTYIDTIIANGSNFDIVVQGEVGINRPFCYIDNVRVELVNKNELVEQLESNWFNYGEHDCTLKINACNSNDGLGFVFGDSGFTPRLRIDGAIVNSQYELTRESILSSIGEKDIYFGRRRKNKELRVPLSPEYYHDFLSLLPLFNNVYIDNKEYFVESDGYELDYNDDLPNYATATLSISEKIQHIETNNSKVKNVGGCQLPPNYLLLVNGNFVNDMENNEPILINE